MDYIICIIYSYSNMNNNIIIDVNELTYEIYSSLLN